MRGQRRAKFGLYLSVALLLVLGTFWGRSGNASDAAWWSFGGQREYSIRSDWGRLIVTSYHATSGATPANVGGESTTPGYADVYPGRPNREISMLGVEWRAGRVHPQSNMPPRLLPPGAATTYYWRLRTYYPLPVALALLPAIPWVMQKLRDRRALRRIIDGLCPACGYDLRASDGAVCPECGIELPPLVTGARN
jgi:hypothetical protein